ncbi:MAG: AraC family transcriptional regulator [Clostridia bacterium]|nr:AraC family transcriptional regulator [Clostridia bacterium]
MKIKFNPHVRYINKVTICLPYPEFLCAFDHRMFFVTSGSFKAELYDKTFVLSEGDILTLPPATPYRLIFESENSANYYIINFDFESNAAHKKVRPPQPAEKFNTADVFSSSSFPPYHEPFYMRLSSRLEPAFSEMAKQESEDIASALMKYILAKLPLTTSTLSENELMQKVKAYINQNFDREISNNSVAKHFSYHPYYLNSLFVQHEKITMHQYINRLRISRAKSALTASDSSVSEIAVKCGFKDASYFVRFFKKNTGLTPKEFRNLAK